MELNALLMRLGEELLIASGGSLHRLNDDAVVRAATSVLYEVLPSPARLAIRMTMGDDGLYRLGLQVRDCMLSGQVGDVAAFARKAVMNGAAGGLADMTARLAKILTAKGTPATFAITDQRKPRAALARRHPREVQLLGVDGDLRFTLPDQKLRAGGVKLGRSRECDVTISHPSVSRSHARIYVDSTGRVVAEDLNSANGTWHNDARIKSVVLNDNSTLRLGHAAFKVHV